MATKSLGTLTIDLLAQIGGFEEGMDKAERLSQQKLRRIEDQAKATGKGVEMAFAGIARSMAAPFAAGISFEAFSSFNRSLNEAQQQSDKLKNSLAYSSGSASSAAREIAYLRDVTRSLGLDFNSTAEAYGKFAAATKGSGITAAQTKDVFEGISLAAAKLGLSADETQGALLALSQMASKGTVQAEELRGQLGERLPGALKIAAQAMGVTQAELGKMLETGQLLASDFLPKFGKVLKEEFAGSVTSLTAELNRLNSSWSLWKQNFANSDGGSFRWLTNGLNESAAAMRSLGNDAGITLKILAAIGGFEAGAVGINKFDTARAQEQAFAKLAEVKRLREELETQESKYGSLPPITANRLEALRAEEKSIRATISDLAVQKGKETGIQLPDLAGELAAAKAKADERMKAYLGDTSNAPRAAKLAAEVEKENKAFQSAVAGLSETDARYIEALQAHNLRVKEIQAKNKEPESAGQRLIDQLQGRLYQAQQLTEVEKLEAELSDRKYRTVTPGEREIATALAEQIDYRRQISEQLDEEIEKTHKLVQRQEQEQHHLQSLINSTPIGQNIQRMNDEALAETALRSGKIDQAQYDQIIEKLHEVKDEGKDAFKELQLAIEGFGRESASALVDFFSGAQTNLKSTVAAMLKELAKLLIYQNLMKPAAAGISGWMSAGLSGLFGSSTVSSANISGLSQSMLTLAKGGVVSGGISDHLNTIRDTPTAFSYSTLHPFAQGGVFGEAGPEAVMPLTRASDGSLGVRSTGAGAGVVNVSVTVNADNRDNTQVSGADTQGAWTQFAGRIKAVVTQEIADQKRPGGLLYG